MKIYITDDDMCTTQKLNLARIQKWLIANDCRVVDAPEDADQILCMTCNGWSLLEERSYDRIRSLSGSHQERLIVMGCVNDAHPEKVARIWSGRTVRTRSRAALSFQEIEQHFPNFTIPLSEIPAQSKFRRIEDYRDFNPRKQFINIAEGCAFNCTFCTHKPGLGPRRSRSLSEIVQQLKAATDEGVDIVTLMGMETSMWGMEFSSNFAKLLDEVLQFDGSYQVHVAQFNAYGIDKFGKELLPLFQNKRVTDIQTPIQSTSTRLLKMMNRKPHTEAIGPFLKSVRRMNPRAVLRTDLIVGWPTETEAERKASLDFAGEHFDEIALYSIELSPDLPAWKYSSDAFDDATLNQIQKSSRAYLESNYPDTVVHSGQQDDNTMGTAEERRKALRMRKMIPLQVAD